MKLPVEVLNFFSKYIESQLGIIYSEDNLFQLESRLAEVSKVLGYKDVAELFEKARGGINGVYKQVLLDIATNNETSFFRDAKVYKYIQSTILPDLVSKALKSNSTLNIWSVASSSGQEPYSISMLLEEMSAMMTLPFTQILATDISERILKKAEKATYSQLEIQRGLPTHLLLKYFTKTEDDQWDLKQSVKKRVAFKSFNLKTDFQLSQKFDFILCRNVLIYQNIQAKTLILNKLSSYLKPGGYFILGSGESLIGLNTNFEQKFVDGIAYYHPQQNTLIKTG